MLAEEGRMGGALYLYRANDSVLRVLEKSGGNEVIGPENVVPAAA